MINAIGAGLEIKSNYMKKHGSPDAKSGVNFCANENIESMPEAHLNIFLGMQKVNLNNSVSFTGKKMKDVPENWGFNSVEKRSGNRLDEKYVYMYLKEDPKTSHGWSSYPYSYVDPGVADRAGNHAKFIEFKEKNRDVLLKAYKEAVKPTYETHAGKESTVRVQVGMHSELEPNGYVYIDKDGNLEHIPELSKDEIRKWIAPDRFENTANEGLIDPYSIIEVLVEDGRLNDAIIFVNEDQANRERYGFSYRDDTAAEFLVKKLIEGGKINDILPAIPKKDSDSETQPEKPDKLNEITKNTLLKAVTDSYEDPLISALIECGHIDEALILFDEKNTELSNSSFPKKYRETATLLINGLIKAGRIDDALAGFALKDPDSKTKPESDRLREAIGTAASLCVPWESLLAKELVLNNRMEEATRLPEFHRVIADELAKIGKLDEAVQKFGGNSSLIKSKLVEEHGYKKAKEMCPDIGRWECTYEDYLEAGEYEEAGIKDRKKEQTLKFISKELDLEKWNEEQRARAEYSGRDSGRWRESVRDGSRGVKRVAEFVATLGISEIRRAERIREAGDVAVRGKNEEINLLRGEITQILAHQLELQDKRAERKYKQTMKQKALVEKMEAARNTITAELLHLIEISRSGAPAKMPNCVMLVGENPYIMRELIDWTGHQADANYVIVPNQLDNNDLQEDLFKELEEAEENYQKTGKRSVIFVENMDKLLKPEINGKDGVAIMKNLMNIANKNYHSTIMFYTKDPSKLDPGTTVSHRVGLRVDVPVSFDDANLLKV